MLPTVVMGTDVVTALAAKTVVGAVAPIAPCAGRTHLVCPSSSPHSKLYVSLNRGGEAPNPASHLENGGDRGLVRLTHVLHEALSSFVPDGV